MNNIANVNDGSLESLLAKRFEKVEARLSALEAESPSTPTLPSDDIPDAKLDDPRFDRDIRKDPPFWAKQVASGKRTSMVGRTYSSAPSDWLTANSGYLDWRAQKGRDERPIRLNNKGKPWHEVDTFEAKLCRAWAKRNKDKPAETTSNTGKGDEFNDIPF